MPFGASIYEAFEIPLEGFDETTSSTADLRAGNNRAIHRRRNQFGGAEPSMGGIQTPMGSGGSGGPQGTVMGEQLGSTPVMDMERIGVADDPATARNFRTDTYDVNAVDFLDVAKISTPNITNQQITPPITPVTVDNLGEPVPTFRDCTGEKCDEVIRYMMDCPDCVKKLRQMLGLGDSGSAGSNGYGSGGMKGNFVLFGYDLTDLNWQQVLFYILIAIFVIAGYEILRMLFGRRGF